jgi:hypothetical protein
MKATYDDTVRMDWLLLDARAILAEADEIGAGRLVRITIHRADQGLPSRLYPARVARYAHAQLAAAPVLDPLARVSFYSRGTATVLVVGSLAAYHAFCQVLLSHTRARLRRAERSQRQAKAALRQNEARLRGQKGGPHS